MNDKPSTELVTTTQPEDSASVLLKAADLMVSGNLSKMTLVEKAQFLAQLAKAENIPAFPPPYAIGLDPQTKKEKIISTKNRAESLRKRDSISTEILYKGPMRNGTPDGDLTFYEVEIKGSTPDGRSAMDLGVVFLGNLQGQERANKIMAAVTKAQNRVTNSLSGSGMLDETEARDMGMRAQEVDLRGPQRIAPRLPANMIEVEVLEPVEAPKGS